MLVEWEAVGRGQLDTRHVQGVEHLKFTNLAEEPVCLVCVELVGFFLILFLGLLAELLRTYLQEALVLERLKLVSLVFECLFLQNALLVVLLPLELLVDALLLSVDALDLV